MSESGTAANLTAGVINTSGSDYGLTLTGTQSDWGSDMDMHWNEAGYTSNE